MGVRVITLICRGGYELCPYLFFYFYLLLSCFLFGFGFIFILLFFILFFVSFFSSIIALFTNLPWDILIGSYYQSTFLGVTLCLGVTLPVYSQPMKDWSMGVLLELRDRLDLFCGLKFGLRTWPVLYIFYAFLSLSSQF